MQTKTASDEIANYIADASNISEGSAEKLFLPESIDDVAAVLRDINAAGVPVTVSGGRTGTVGGAIPNGGIVISMERLNEIGDVDRQSLSVVAGAGATLADVQRAAESAGLFYPPDPTEWSAQIGGTVATNASGARSFKYGSTRQFVSRIKVVLADGRIVDIPRGKFVSDESGHLNIPELDISLLVPTYTRPNVRKNVSGYFNQVPLDLVDLFVGSEGTLGVIAEVELQLVPKPESFFGGIVFFPEIGGLLSFVDEVREVSFRSRAAGDRNSIDAAVLEYFDDNSLQFISEKFPETPADVAGAIFFEQETNSGNDEVLLEAWNAAFEKHGADLDRSWFTTTDADMEKMREFRHALPVSVNERIARYKQRKVGTDMAVPDDRFAAFLKFYRSTLDASGLDYVIFGHIGDCHLHANMLPKDAAEAEKARHIYGRCIAQAIMLGGTVSAEHGIGKLKRHYLAAMMGERYLSEMAAVKLAFDPKGILGRGNMFDTSYLAA